MPPRGQRGRALPQNRLLVTGGVFAGIFALVLIDPDSAALWFGLYTIPVVFVAQQRGRIGGAVAAGLAIALGIVGAEAAGVGLGLRDHAVHAVVVLGVAWVAGGGSRGHASSASLADAPALDDLELRRLEAQRLVGLGSWELDLATGDMLWSEQYRELYGVDPNTFVASRGAFQLIVHEDDRWLLNDAVDQIARDGTTVEVRYRITRPSDGAERCIRSHITARRGADGALDRVVGTGQDVTDLVMVLSRRESEILMLLAEGVSGEDIATRLFLSPATVRTHVRNAMGKLGAHTRGQAIATALRSKEIGS